MPVFFIDILFFLYGMVFFICVFGNIASRCPHGHFPLFSLFHVLPFPRSCHRTSLRIKYFIWCCRKRGCRYPLSPPFRGGFRYSYYLPCFFFSLIRVVYNCIAIQFLRLILEDLSKRTSFKIKKDCFSRKKCIPLKRTFQRPKDEKPRFDR